MRRAPPQASGAATVPMVEPLLTVEQTCELLNLSRRCVYELVQRRAIPCYRVSKYLRFRRAELLEWLARKRVPPLEERHGGT